MPSPSSRVLLPLILLLGACTPRGEFTFMPEATSVGEVETVLVATDRMSGPGQPLYGTERSETLSFSRFNVSIPPDRADGSVVFPRRQPADPRTDFVVASAQRLADENAFVGAVNRDLRSRPNSGNEVVVFVHGFNSNFAEGVYRQAQIQHDLRVAGTWIQFAWPSAAIGFDYLYDRESAIYSRDSLESLIEALARSNADSFNLVAHSMGAFLVMETLRTMAREGNPALAKVEAVILMSPDIDIDVFRRQARPVLARGIPVFALVSTRDRALLFSAFMRGETRRVGSISSAEELGDVEVTVVDVSAIEGADPLGHFAVANSPVLISLFGAAREKGVDIFATPRRTGIIAQSATIIQQGTTIVLAPLAQ